MKNVSLAFEKYNARTTIIMYPFSEPNSGPAMVQIFSRIGAVRYAFCMSQPSTFKSFSATIMKSIRTESLDTTEEYVMLEGTSVTCPPATILAFRRKFSPILTSKIR